MREVKRTNQFFLILMITFIVANFGVSFLYIFINNTRWLDNILLFLPQMIMLLLGIIYIKKSGQKFWTTIRFKPISALTVFLLIVMGITMIPMVTFINVISMMFSTNLVESTLDGAMSYGFFFSLLTMAIIPSFVEETIYRGIFANDYMKRNWKVGVIISGLLFGMMHMNFNQFSYALFIGILFAVVMEITDSILSSMILHFMINGSSVVSYFVLLKAQEFLGIQEEVVSAQSMEITWMTVAGYFIPALISAIIFFSLLFMIAKLNGREEVIKNKLRGKSDKRLTESVAFTEEGEDGAAVLCGQSRKIWTWHLTVGTILCIIMALMIEIVN